MILFLCVIALCRKSLAYSDDRTEAVEIEEIDLTGLVASNIPRSELQYLQDFYDATNGPHWIGNYTDGIPWDFSGDPNPCLDNWEGITCTVKVNTSHVSKLVLPYYNLSGSIPDNIYELTYLSDFNLRNNMLVETIPSTIGELQYLKYFVLYANEITGTLPESIGQLSVLEELDLGINKFHGSIPDSFGDLSNLLYLYLHGNGLSGYLPASLGNLDYLFVVQLEANQLSGTIPQSFGNLNKIREMIFYGNKLTGPLPDNWGGMHASNSLDWGQNYFTGTIPAYFGTLTAMEYFFVDRNYLTGTIPPQLGNFASVSELFLYRNFLTGSVPTTFSNFRRITDLNLHVNFLGGSLDGVFNASNQKLLTYMRISTNYITGTVPDELYRLPSLQFLIMAVNCFTASLSDAMCYSPSMQILSLDGQSTATACRRVLLPGLSHSYVTKDAGKTALPPCVFQLPRLQTLHLSATGLTGTLPADVVISPSLTVLSLSHNILTGSIPYNFQSHAWLALDLSYNKLGGTMESALAINDTVTSGVAVPASLYLADNRISGGVPPSVRDLVNVSVLGSNLLHCDVKGTDLPAHDSDSSKYTCGSTAFEVPYYVWLVIAGVVTALLVAIVRYRKLSRFLAYLRMWLTVSSGTYGQWKDNIKSVAIVSRVCELLCRTASWCLAYILLVLMPLYVALGYYYNTMTYRYAYSLSAAFLSGVVPASLILITLMGLPVVLVIVYVRYLPSYTVEEMKIRLDSRTSRNLSTSSLQEVEVSFQAKVSNAFVYLAFCAINLAVVVGVNYVYIYAVLYQSNRYLVISQIGTAFFKLAWSGPGINYLVRKATLHLVLNDHDVKTRAVETRFILLQILLTLFNNIVIPCVVVAFVSESCYYYIFVPAPQVDVYLPYDVCTSTLLGRCVQDDTGVTFLSFAPPYHYGYQCSSSIIAIYAPVFVTMCIMAMFGMPLIELGAQKWHSQANPQSLAFKLVDNLLPRILKPIDVLNEEELQVRPERYFHVNQLLVGLINLLGLLLTFGAVFPPLAVALAATLIAVTYFAKLKLGRFMCNAVSAQRLNYVYLIEAECQRAGVVTVLYRSAWILVVFSCLFYTLFIFDTLGDSVGLSRAFWVLIVVPLMPLVIYASYSLLDVLINKTGADATERAKQDAVMVEMHSIDRTVSVVTDEDVVTFNVLLFGQQDPEGRSKELA